MAVDVSSRLELLVDDFLIESMKDVELKLQHPTPREIAVYCNAPWEGPISFYVTVFKDDDRYRMYYRGENREGGPPAVTSYAESRDGIRWEKPPLGVFEFGGSKKNSIVWDGEGTHNFAPFKDSNPAAPDTERYKALAGGPLIAFASEDGIHWRKMREEPVITKGKFDSQNLAFWDTEQGCYAAYFRDSRDGFRDIRRCTSADFVNWSEPEWLDYGDVLQEHLYTNATTPYFRAPHIYLAFPKRFVPSRKAVDEHPNPGVSDGVFMTSRDGIHWHRWMEAFLRPGLDCNNWTERNNHIAYGVVPTGKEEISIYWVEHYRHPTCHIRRGTLRTDGFVSVHAPYADGELLTKLLKFKGSELVINYSTSAVGSIRVEIRDEQGKPIPGYTLDESPEIYGDEIERVVAWSNGPDVSTLAGRPVRLRFLMRDADLYSIRFRT